MIDTGIWILFICIAFKMPSVIYKTVRKLSIAFILIQLISISFILITMPEIPSFKKYSFDENTKFAFSAKKNVIILIIDAFQTDVFQEIIGEDERYKNIFKGFTYFRNSVSGFRNTLLSVPLILTGQYYDNSIPMQEFMKKAFCSSSIPKFLKDNGFKVDLFPRSYNFIYSNEKIASNMVKKRKLSKDSTKKATYDLYNISMFRYMPHFVKNHVYNGVHNGVTRLKGTDDPNNNFIKKMINSSSADIEKYAFKFYHLDGLHPPFHLNERIEYESLPQNRVGYKRQAKGMLRLAELFLDKLDKLGISDDSMIFIIGDHGLGDVIGINIPENLRAKDIRPIHLGSAIERALPLILIKPFNSKGELRISDAPVCLSDIPKTIASELDLKNDFSGDSMFKVKESDIRERRSLLCNSKDNYSRNDFLPSMKEYVVSGFSWLNESWRLTGRRFSPPTQKWLGPAYFKMLKTDMDINE
ncbi:MAG: sulfatase-like hydrolase/transferase [Candidatus Omnitrophica bacterium]|nr:sulfatase-like hydrolase/transferase [Candidatus Omnitrophota bacterium]